MQVLLFLLLVGWAGAARPAICNAILPLEYPCEEHKVVTEDGYILGMTRIPPRNEGAPAVLLVHGLLDTAATFINNGPEESLGFMLADAGYDVWLGNSRGNTFSDDHTHLDPKSQAFWDGVDWGLMAEYDVPALVAFVIKTAKVNSVAWIGHSQGTVQAFAALSMSTPLPVSIMIGLAPVTHVSHITSPVMRALINLDLPELLRILGQKEFLPNSAVLHDLGYSCDAIPVVCKMALLAICGADLNNINGSRVEYYLNWEPGATSLHNLQHWAQSYKKDTFAMYDYGHKGNMKHYNQTTAPAFDATLITTPVALFSGEGDTVATPIDVQVTRSLLRNIVYDKVVPKYGHLDFTWGMNAHQLVYPDVLGLLSAHHGKH